jgi:hypothetical protein
LGAVTSGASTQLVFMHASGVSGVRHNGQALTVTLGLLNKNKDGYGRVLVYQMITSTG